VGVDEPDEDAPPDLMELAGVDVRATWAGFGAGVIIGGIYFYLLRKHHAEDGLQNVEQLAPEDHQPQ
jgi:hypothetical protein